MTASLVKEMRSAGMDANGRITYRVPTPLLYLDLDGTVRHGFDELGRFVNSPADVFIYPGTRERLAAYKRAGWRIAAVSNQGGVALGHCSLGQMGQVQIVTQRLAGGFFDRMFMCVHHPEAHDPEMAICMCRKPKIGMLVLAAYDLGQEHMECYPPYMALMVGDRPEDAECARNAGVAFQWASEWRTGPLPGAKT